jgi:transposase
VGHPPLTATRYEQQMLRCSACLERFEAPLPEGVTPQKYDATADVALVLNKYGQMTPWTRQAEVQELCGLPLAEATQWERCECVADALLPVKLEMERQAAQAELVGADDTGVKILSHLQAQKSVPAKERRATHTTGLVASNTTGNITSKIIVLFESGAHHAGEVIGRLFKLRQAEAGQPIQQGDGSASNWSHDAEVIAAKCWAHAGRPFEELKKNFPAAASFVQSSIAELYRTERKASDLKLSAAERLLLHQQESGMVLLRFKAWLAQQWEEKLVEPNSACGQALRYLENHWQELTEFLRTPGIPLDNNAVERALRRPALLRRNALFFKTEHGAAIGSLLLGILETCKVNGVNAWEYLLAVYRNARAVREKPFDWTPWRWADLQTPPAG